MLRLSHAHLCSEHFAECDFVNFMAEYQMGFTSKRNLQRVTDLYKIPIWISKDETDEQQAHSMIPKTERYTETLKQAETKKSNTNAYGRKGRERERLYTNACGKERKNRPQMPVAKKERPDHKCWWQTKNGCPNQSSKRLTPTEKWNPPSWNHLKIPNGYLPANIRWKKQNKKTTTPNHNSLIDYCLQQRSGRLQS